MSRLLLYFSLFCLILSSQQSTYAGEAMNQESATTKENVYPLLTVSPETSKNGSEIVLSDGSRWFVPFYSRSSVAKWNAGDKVEMTFYTFTKALFKTYPWITIKNIKTQDSTTVSLTKMPEATNESVWIYAIDAEKGEITFNTGTVFIVPAQSAFFGLTTIPAANMIACWKEGDIITVLNAENSLYELLNLTLVEAGQSIFSLVEAKAANVP